MDSDAEKAIEEIPNYKEIIALRDQLAHKVEEEIGEDSETAIMDCQIRYREGSSQRSRI